jgi:hypothetical protein
MLSKHSGQITKHGGNIMAVSVHSGGSIGKALLYVAAFVAFVVVALTWVPDWISPEGTNGTGNRNGIQGDGVGSTARMIQ